MSWNLKPDRPIYSQLLEYIQIFIISGKYKPGEKLPSVRDLAEEASVNPNTMQKALAELERVGLVYTQRTNGRFITEDKNMIRMLKENVAQAQIREFFDNMELLGFSIQESVQLIIETGKERQNECDFKM